jgi:acyl-CoA synthetase (AMP-forming)/AMP-acid ligase II
VLVSVPSIMAAPDNSNPLQATLVAILNAHAAKTPTAPFLQVSKDEFIDYASFKVLTQSLLPPRLLSLASGLEQSSRIMVIARNSPLIPLLLWSSWSIGICVVLVPPTTDANLWLPMAQLTQPSAIFVMDSIHEEVSTRLAATGLPIVSLEQLLPSSPVYSKSPLRATIDAAHNLLSNPGVLGNTPLDSDFSPDPLTPNIILFTSSAVDVSTLKCVEYSHSMCVASSWRTVIAFGGHSFIQTPKRHLGWLPLSHCFELTIALM